MIDFIDIVKYWMWLINPSRKYMPLPQKLFWVCLNGMYSPKDFSKKK